MNVALNPQAQRFVEDQIRTGRYQTPEAVLEEAVERMMREEEPRLDEATLDAIDESEEQIEQGDYRDWKEVSAELRARYIRK